jgi:hypothetical protein
MVMGWKIIQATVFLVVFFWAIWLGQQPGFESARNPYIPAILAFLAALFVAAIPVMRSDLRRMASRVLGRDREQGGAGKKRIGGGA